MSENGQQQPTDEVGIRFRHILIPLLTLAVGFCVAYSALNWLLVTWGNLLPLSDDVADCWLPLGLAWLVTIVLVRPALALLKRDQRRYLPILYHAAAVAMIALPTVLLQGFVRSATGQLTHVRSLADISGTTATKYFSADELCVDQSRAWTQPTARPGGSSNDHLDFDVYVVTPLCRADRARSHESVWVGYEFHRAVSNQLSADEKNSTFSDFIRQSQARVWAGDPHSIVFFERLGRSSNRKQFAALLARAGVDLDAPLTLLLIPHSERFADRSGARLQWALACFAVGAALWLGIARWCPLDPAAVAAWRAQIGAGWAPRLRLGAPGLSVPQRGGYGLQVLVALNILVYAAMVLAGLGFLSFDTDALINWGANYRPALHGVGYLRLITSEFVHSGFLHLVNNVYGLLLAALFLLPITGDLGLIACYLIGGLGGSIASAYIHPATVSVGASGAVFGLFGVLLVHLVLGDKRLAAVRGKVLPGIAVFVVLNLLIGAASPGIDNAAHIGGFVSGVLIGLMLFAQGSVRRRSTAPV